MDWRLFSWSWLLACVFVLGSANGAPYGVNYKRLQVAVRQVDCEELVEQCLSLLSQRCAAEIPNSNRDVEEILECCDEVFQLLECFGGELDICLPLQVIDIIRDFERDCEQRQTQLPTATPKQTEPASTVPTDPPAETATEVPTTTLADTPTEAATEVPTITLADTPTEAATEVPTTTLADTPTEAATEVSSDVPTVTPTGAPTAIPTGIPSEDPTEAPTEVLIEPPTDPPTAIPTGTLENSSSPATSPSSTSTPTPASPPACFPGDATVLISDGTEKPMRLLEAGDKVMVAGGDFSAVYAFGHKDSAQQADFIRIETESGHAIDVSSSHYVLIADELVAARKVQLGDQLTIAGLGNSRVRVVSSVRRSGVYSPHTLDGTLVVNGIEASCHTETVKPLVADLLMAIPKILYRMGVNEPLGSMLYKSTPPYVYSFLKKLRISAA